MTESGVDIASSKAHVWWFGTEARGIAFRSLPARCRNGQLSDLAEAVLGGLDGGTIDLKYRKGFVDHLLGLARPKCGRQIKRGSCALLGLSGVRSVRHGRPLLIMAYLVDACRDRMRER